MSWGAMLGPAFGAAAGMFMGDLNRQKQVQQQRELNAVNEESAKNMGKFNYEQQMKMLKETGPKFQVGQLKEAGMSVGNMYGGAGSGGAIKAEPMSMQAGNAEGASASTGAATQMGMLGAQVALMGAQKENIEADTKNKEAAAGNLNAGTGKIGAETTKVETETQNLNVERFRNELELEIRKDTRKDATMTIAAMASRAMNEAQSSLNMSRVGTATVDAQIKRIEAESIGAILENAATRQGIRLDQAQIDKMRAEIEQGWESLRLQGRGQDVQERNMAELTKSMLISSGINAAGNIVNSIIDIKKMKMGKALEKNNESIDVRDAYGELERSYNKMKY